MVSIRVTRLIGCLLVLCLPFLALADGKPQRLGLFHVETAEPEDGSICGTHPEHVHLLEQVALGRSIGEKPVPSQPAGSDVGEIAILEDDGTLSLRGTGPIDLPGSSLRFRPGVDGGHDIDRLDSAELPRGAGQSLAVDPDGAVRVDFRQGFRFEFFGVPYREMFVSENGVVSFGGPFPAAVGGPETFLRAVPAIAPLPTDLDLSAGGRIYVIQDSREVSVVWEDVPEAGVGGANTVFLTLRRDGTFDMGFPGITSLFVPVGVTPGGLRPGLNQLDYTADLPIRGVQGAVLEVFFPEGTRLLDLASIGQKFYETHADEYDTIVIWSSFPFSIRAGFAFYQFLHNEVQGLGLQHIFGTDQQFDQSELFGSDGALKGLLNMNFVGLYPDDPEEPFLRTNTTLSIMGQEAGHRFGSFVWIDRDPGPAVLPSTELLGRGIAHWSFVMNTEASHLEGNGWDEVEDGVFETTEATQRFSELDEYLIGIRAAEDVSPFWFIDPQPQFSGSITDVTGVQLPGLPPLDVLIDDTQDFGPAQSLFTSNTSPRTFFLVTNPGTERQALSIVVGNGIDDSGANPGAMIVFSLFGPLGTVAKPGDPYIVVIDPSAPPQTNLFNAATGRFDGPPVTVRGQRVDVTVDDIVAVEGPRRPVAGAQPKVYRQAFLLLSDPDSPASAEQIEKLERVRAGWVEEYSEATGGRGEMQTALVPRGKPRLAVALRNDPGPGAVGLFDTGGSAIGTLEPFDEPGTQIGSIAAFRMPSGRHAVVAGAAAGAPGLVRALRADGSALHDAFAPFGSGFRAGVHVAAGDLDGDGPPEIVAALADRGDRVRAFRGDGSAAAVSFRAGLDRGVQVAVGDLDGDGAAEIVAAGERDGDTVVRVFRGDGRFSGVEISGFEGESRRGRGQGRHRGQDRERGHDDRSGRGGNSTPPGIAVGDLDGDGRAEIVVAIGARLMAYDADGSRVGFSADTVALGAALAFRGKRPALSAGDPDLDGMAEIVVGDAQDPGALVVVDGDGSLVRAGRLAGALRGTGAVAVGDY